MRVDPGVQKSDADYESPGQGANPASLPWRKVHDDR
jgi:hypothetical protein